MGAGVHRRVHLGVGRPDPAGGPARLGSGVPDRPGPDIGYAPVANRGVPALEPDRLAHVSGTYLSAETFSLANAPLIDAQAGISFARVLGGGLVAAIDGMRFVVPVPSVYARPTAGTSAPSAA